MNQAREVPLEPAVFQDLLTAKVAEVAAEPEYDWRGDFQSFMKDGDGRPVVRVAITNCAPDMDIWEGLRTPAHVGMYPLGLSDIWMHYAAANVRSTRHDGSPNPLAMPETYEEALGRLRRGVIVSIMLAVNPDMYETYAEKIERGDADPFDYYKRATGEVGSIIDKAAAKFALALVTPERAVVPMAAKNVAAISDRTRSDYFSGRYHGPNNSHWPQNSVTALTGLMQFGVNRLSFRDEIWPDGSRRLYGRYTSMVIFDEQDPVADGGAGVTLLDSDRLVWLRRLSGYTDVPPDMVAGRYCTYNVTDGNGASICSKCLDTCPSGALRNSSPLPDGSFAQNVAAQNHRFWEGTVDFDAGNCCRERGQKAQLFEEYVCARCEAICAARGIRKSVGELEKMG